MNMLTTNDDSIVPSLKTLKEGDKLYGIEFSHNGKTGEDVVVSHTFEFKNYEKIDKKSNIESIIPDNDQQILATIVDIKYPNTLIQHQDLSAGFFFSIHDAIESSEEMISTISKALKKFKKQQG